MSKSDMDKAIEQCKKAYEQYDEAFDLATVLFNGNVFEVNKWMQTPSDLLFGDSPTQAILSGDGQVVIDWLKGRTGNV